MNAGGITGMCDGSLQPHMPGYGRHQTDVHGRGSSFDAQMLELAELAGTSRHPVVAVKRAIDENAEAEQDDGTGSRR